ncbi:MAG: DUF177 domain-containing protein [Bacteroidetes bacterium]|nr:DUF177 domain-containing protein [Bacteroidota bacterium]
MDKLKHYEIDFGGKAFGKHRFTYELNEEFFAIFEGSIVQNASFTAQVEMNKQKHMIQFDISLSGSTQVICDRCNDPFEMDLNSEHLLLLKMGDHVEEEDVDVYVIPQTQTTWNIAQQLYEYVCTAMPMRIVHPEGKCNPEFMKTLEHINDHDETEQQEDPRWKKLKNINLN